MAAPCLPYWEAVVQIVKKLKAHPNYEVANGHLQE